MLQWACNSLAPPVDPVMPDGSWLQFRHCYNHGLLATTAFAIITRGALLFRFSSDPRSGGRPAQSHVALSLGDGSTVEARGAAFGVGSWTSDRRIRGWTHAALIPGADYELRAPSFRTLRLRSPRMFGTDVAWLQERLIHLGFGRTIVVPVDGVFGPKTAAAVWGFQSERALEPDGIVGPITWGALQ